MSQLGLFDIDNRLKDLSALKDPFETLKNGIPWDLFRKYLNKALRKDKKNIASRKPYDGLLMFKILILQSLYGLSDYQIELQIKARFSFMRFLSLGGEDRIPDEKTV